MKNFITKDISIYTLVLLFTVTIAGIILLPNVTNVFILLAVLSIVFIVVLLMFIYLSEKYVQPLTKMAETMEKILQGNYHARIHYGANGIVSDLSNKINQLARNLSELTIQERIQAEQLSTVIENSPTGLALIDDKGYIHLVNRKFLALFGKAAKDYHGHLYYEALPLEPIQQTIQKTFLTEQNEKQLLTLTKPDQSDMHLEIVTAPIFDERNMLKGAVLVINDITEFKQLEVVRKDFVANVSHELKTPITSIRGFAETLLDGAGEDPEARQQFLQIIFQESKRIQVLIEDLLILSKIEHDERNLTISNVEIDHLFNELMPLFQQRADEAGIKLSVDIEQGITFAADGEKVKQVLLNLYTNAVNYTPKGGSVSVVIKKEAPYIKMQVADTGIGIKKSALPRIFERFYRVDKDRSRKTGGTGLGLAIVKHIVEAHRGKIEVESEIDVGSTFTVYLPIDQEE